MARVCDTNDGFYLSHMGKTTVIQILCARKYYLIRDFLEAFCIFSNIKLVFCGEQKQECVHVI